MDTSGVLGAVTQADGQQKHKYLQWADTGYIGTRTVCGHFDILERYPLTYLRS